MYKLGINFENVLSVAKELNLTVPETLNKLKLIGVSALDAEYSRVSGENSYLNDIVASRMELKCVYYMANFAGASSVISEMKVVDFCEKYGVKNVMFLTEPNVNVGGNEKTLKHNLRKIVNYARNFKISVSIENFGLETSWFSSVEKIKDLVKSVKNLTLTFDTGNFLLAGIDPNFAYDELKFYVSRVHLKNRSYAPAVGAAASVDINGNDSYTTAIFSGSANLEEFIKKVIGDYKVIDFILEYNFADTRVFGEIEQSAVDFYAVTNE